MLPPQALFLGSYPPRECGIATFTKDMVDAYDRAFGFSSPVIAIDEPGAEVRRYSPEVDRAHPRARVAIAMRRPRSWSTSTPSISSTFNTNTDSLAATAATGSWISCECSTSRSF